MATYYVRTDGNNGNAGTSDSSGGAWLTLEYAGATAANGDTIMVRASAGNAATYPTSSLDYTISAYFTPTAGSGTHVKWIGYNGIPTIGSPGLGFYNTNSQWFEGLYFVATTGDNPTYGIIHSASRLVVKNCIFNLNSKASLKGVVAEQGLISGCDFYGGTTSPSASSGAYLIQSGEYGLIIEGCRIRYGRDIGIMGAFLTSVRNCLIYGNVGTGLEVQNNSIHPADIAGNTINGNGGHGIYVSQSNGAGWCAIRNNIISNHTGGSKYGIDVATSSSDERKLDWDYNLLYNNTAHFNNVTAGAHDLIDVNPNFVNASAGDFTPQEATLEGAAFPTAF